jgi:hypothetical protein
MPASQRRYGFQSLLLWYFKIGNEQIHFPRVQFRGELRSIAKLVGMISRTGEHLTQQFSDRWILAHYQDRKRDGDLR